jgi:hypothetical protein
MTGAVCMRDKAPCLVYFLVGVRGRRDSTLLRCRIRNVLINYPRFSKYNIIIRFTNFNRVFLLRIDLLTLLLVTTSDPVPNSFKVIYCEWSRIPCHPSTITA